MTAFDFKVHFAGLCTFIENQKPKPAVGMCVVLPKAPAHEAKISIENGNGTILNSSGNPVSQIDLNGHRVDFKLSGGDVGKGFKFTNKLKPSSGQAAIELAQIVPKIAQSNPQIVSDKNVAPEVRAQILLRQGEVKPDDSLTWRWRLEQNPFKPSSQEVVIAYEVLWLLSIDTAEIWVTPINGGSPERYSLAKGANGIELVISNDCMASEASAVDEDFSFHYDLLHTRSRDQRQALSVADRFRTLPVRIESPQKILALLSLAQSNLGIANSVERLKEKLERVKVKVESTGGGGTGCNCLGCVGQKLVIPDF
jgi:hypothetical protein